LGYLPIVSRKARKVRKEKNTTLSFEHYLIELPARKKCIWLAETISSILDLVGSASRKSKLEERLNVEVSNSPILGNLPIVSRKARKVCKEKNTTLSFVPYIG